MFTDLYVQMILWYNRKWYGWDLQEYTYQCLLRCKRIEELSSLVRVLHSQLVNLDGVVPFLVDTLTARRGEPEYETLLIQMSRLHRMYGNDLGADGYTVNVIWSCVSFVEYEKNYNLLEKK